MNLIIMAKKDGTCRCLAKPHGGIGWMLKPDDGSVIFKRALSI